MKSLAFVGGQGEAVWPDEVVDDRADLSARAVDAEHVVLSELAVSLVPFVVRENAVRRIGKPDRSVRSDDGVVGAVQALALVVVGDDSQAAVVLGPDDAPTTVLARDQPALAIDGVAIRVVGRLAKHADRAVALVVSQHPVVGDVREDEVARGGEVRRALGPSRAGPEALDVGRSIEAVEESRIEDFVI